MTGKTGALAILAATAIAAALWVRPAHALQIFSDGFESGANPAWSTGQTDATETASFSKFLGRYSDSGDTLALTGLAVHTTATLHFDLYLIDSWDGAGEPGGGGPDVFEVVEGGTNTLFSDTFCNNPTASSFTPCSHSVATGPPTIGPSMLGFGSRVFDSDAIYRDLMGGFTFAHSSSTLTLDFRAIGLQELADESWGIDNVTVDISGLAPTRDIPEPATLLLLISGLVGLGVGARRRPS